MRKEKSIINATTAIISNAITLLLGFILQRSFINTLGDEFLGLNSIFNNVISMLSIAELGIGTAIIYSLYKPLYNDNKEEIKSLLMFYKRTYNIIAIVVFTISLILMPFIPKIVNTNLNINVYLVFLLFIIDIIFSYLLSYKRSILQADQRGYVISIIHIVYTICLNVCLGLILYLTKDYYLYLFIKCIWRLIENIAISIYVDKTYPYIKGNATKLDDEIHKSIIQKVRGLIFHKIGSFIVLGTDNLIISHYLGNIVVAYYSNYYLITSAASTLLSQVFSAITPSVGNLLVEENKEKNYNLFKKIMFSNFWIYCFASVGIFTCMSSFISLWVGSERVLSIGVLAIITINFYMMGMRSSIGIFKDAAGIFYEDRFIPIIESVFNILFSIILVNYFGLAGVFIGTFLSSLIVVFYSLPYFVFKRLFNTKISNYYRLYLMYFGLTLLFSCLTKFLLDFIVNILALNSSLIIFVLGVIISILIPNFLNIIIFKSSEEYKYFYFLVKTIINNVKRHLVICQDKN